MTPPEAKEHSQAFAKAVRSIEKLPQDRRMPNLNQAWKTHGLPVQMAFHALDGVGLYSIYGEVLRTYGRAVSAACNSAT